MDPYLARASGDNDKLQHRTRRPRGASGGAAAAQPARRDQREGTLTVLIVENDAATRKDLRETVQKLGHRTLVAGEGMEAWWLYQSTHEVDVVVSSWTLPGIDGLELCRRVRASDRGGYTYFILLSDLLSEPGGEGRLSASVEAGADDYLTKPLDGEQLRARLLVASRLTSLHRHPDGNGMALVDPGVVPAVDPAAGNEIALRDGGAANGSLSKANGFLS